MYVCYVYVSVCPCSCLQVDMCHVCASAEVAVNDRHLPQFLSTLKVETRSL